MIKKPIRRHPICLIISGLILFLLTILYVLDFAMMLYIVFGELNYEIGFFASFLIALTLLVTVICCIGLFVVQFKSPHIKLAIFTAFMVLASKAVLFGGVLMPLFLMNEQPIDANHPVQNPELYINNIISTLWFSIPLIIPIWVNWPIKTAPIENEFS